MKRLAIGAALGGLAVYLYDPEYGLQRRARLSSLVRENTARVMQAASPIVGSARPVVLRTADAASRVDLKNPVELLQPGRSLRKVLSGAAVGAALVYFMDPVKGSQRRKSALEAGRKLARELTVAAKPVPGLVSDRLASSLEMLKSKAS